MGYTLCLSTPNLWTDFMKGHSIGWITICTLYVMLMIFLLS